MTQQYSNIRYLGEDGSGELIIDTPNRIDCAKGDCQEANAKRVVSFIRKGWLKHIVLIGTAVSRETVLKNNPPELIKKLKAHNKKIKKKVLNPHINSHCLIWNTKTNQVIDTSNNRIMILNYDEWKEDYMKLKAFITYRSLVSVEATVIDEETGEEFNWRQCRIKEQVEVIKRIYAMICKEAVLKFKIREQTNTSFNRAHKKGRHTRMKLADGVTGHYKKHALGEDFVKHMEMNGVIFDSSDLASLDEKLY